MVYLFFSISKHDLSQQEFGRRTYIESIAMSKFFSFLE